MAAGGIVLRRGATPLIAVVRQRKRNEWVLPKGKLDAGETPRDAAEREVLEETGHDVSVHEFLGTLIHETSHFTVVAGTHDYAYGQSDCYSLANSSPTKAVHNADSHEYFAEIF